MPPFQLNSPFMPAGDQPAAIQKIVANLNAGVSHQTLLGATGTGKTFTMANVVAQLQKPTLVIAHNKTLAAQLCSEFREFFPDNAISYFVSYYDYYQPEAYIARTDTYIEKDAAINEEIEKFRHAATYNLLTRRDVLIVASVSCIYGLGDVSDYEALAFEIKTGEACGREKLLRRLADLQYTRSHLEFKQGMVHVMGEVVEIFPPGADTLWRIEFFGDEVERITECEALTGEEKSEAPSIKIFPAKHNVTTREKIERAAEGIKAELTERVAQLKSLNKIVEAERVKTRTEYDLEMLLETGYVSGIENYTRYLTNRGPGEEPATLLDYFPDDYLLIIDESHMTVPQIGGMFSGNQQRKTSLIEHGFRLPSSFDNRPLKFSEFEKHMAQTVYISATPGQYELKKSQCEKCARSIALASLDNLAENKVEEVALSKAPIVKFKPCAECDVIQQIIRPTGLIDPEVVVRPSKNQIEDLLKEIRGRIERQERALVTTLTKRMSEELTDYLRDAGIKVKYLHSDIETLERIEILRDLRLGEIDVVVGINLLREGLDLPEVSFIAILDADKPGFLRSTSALIQTIGRCARNVHGFVVMYGDRITDGMQGALDETDRRRQIQVAFNEKHGITPKTIEKAIKDIAFTREKKKQPLIDVKKIPKENLGTVIRALETQMRLASENLEFEKAAELRDQIAALKGR